MKNTEKRTLPFHHMQVKNLPLLGFWALVTMGCTPEKPKPELSEYLFKNNQKIAHVALGGNIHFKLTQGNLQLTYPSPNVEVVVSGDTLYVKGDTSPSDTIKLSMPYAKGIVAKNIRSLKVNLSQADSLALNLTQVDHSSLSVFVNHLKLELRGGNHLISGNCHRVETFTTERAQMLASAMTTDRFIFSAEGRSLQRIQVNTLLNGSSCDSSLVEFIGNPSDQFISICNGGIVRSYQP